ncbi:MAG: hypothetical protein RIT28_2590 [Pseudomonadota bacterium]
MGAVWFALAFAACKGGDDHDKPHTDDTEVDDSDDTAPPADDDGDGYTTEEDCDDGDAAVNPAATELCDLVDNNCDGTADEGLAACFYGTDGSAASVEDLLAAGVETAPAELVLSSSGRLVLGAGEWFTSLRISADVTIEGAGVDETTLSSGALLSLVVIEDNPTAPYAVQISGLSLVDGAGSQTDPDTNRSQVGGAIFCRSTASSPTQVTLNDVAVSETSAQFGSLAYATGCVLSFNDSTFVGVAESVASKDGGALYLIRSDVTLTNVSLTGYHATRYGGAVYADLNSSFTMIDSVVSDNSAGSIGGHFFSFGPVVCEGSTAAAGVRGGVSDDIGGGVYLGDDLNATVTSTGCDWGSGGDDNSPDDIASDYYSGEQFSTESFTCDAYNGCTAG